VIEQNAFTPEQAAAELSTLFADAVRLAAMAAAAKSAGTLDAADKLAELVMKIAS
jgi:UDP-N-acetylglucosamine--N-acetylmuramyl-(pentapeptide) pyrophosphoryl-undecaprenol N-acetylglucosamine transferase